MIISLAIQKKRLLTQITCYFPVTQVYFHQVLCYIMFESEIQTLFSRSDFPTLIFIFISTPLIWLARFVLRFYFYSDSCVDPDLLRKISVTDSTILLLLLSWPLPPIV